ncbi:MAG: NAD(P)H-dependent glycerol-3-phosphate dehydrogenase [Flavobacteriales bacterium]|jgi:glycerol-3-phosphate dehydrogenase (NAD(P)+)|nr:NAD(P)H-dependent glycerol-3-phosphate dehydrogenase [Flavobacteriales bacterium]
MQEHRKKIAIVGGGSWATALAYILSKGQENILWWMRSEENINDFQREGKNPNYLTDAHFDTDSIEFSTDLRYIVHQAQYIILAIPSAFLHLALQNSGASFKNKIVFSAIKGIVPETNQIIGEYLMEHYQVPAENIGVITGPCHAEEVALERLSYLTIASENEKHRQFMAEKLRCNFIATTESDDIYGTEISAVLKNVYAIVIGIAHGVRYGDNFKAVLISNAIREIKRFVDAYHPIDRDINDSAYLGDLLVTCYSKFSRNRTFGVMLGQGYSVKSAQVEMNMVAEGYYAIKCMHAINEKYQVNMPILETAFNTVYRSISPRIELKILSDQLN